MKIQEAKAILQDYGYSCVARKGELIVNKGKRHVETLRNFPIHPWEIEPLIEMAAAA